MSQPAPPDATTVLLDAVVANLDGVDRLLSDGYRQIREYNAMQPAVLREDVVATGLLLIGELVTNLRLKQGVTASQLDICTQSAERRFLQGIPLESMLQGYRVLGKTIWNLVHEAAVESHSSSEVALFVGGKVMEFVDSISNAATRRNVELTAGYAFDREMSIRDLLDALIASDELTARHVEIADKAGVRLDAPGVVAVIRRDSASATSDDLLRVALGRIRRQLAQGRVLAGVTPHGIVVVGNLEDGDDDARRFADQVGALVASPGMRALRAGIGRPFASPAGVIRSFHDSIKSLNGVSAGQVGTFERALLRNFLDASPYRDAVHEATIEKLRAYDGANDAQLLETLRNYALTRFNLTRTARMMHVQPNSISYRLKRVTEITGFDTSSTGDLIALVLGVGIDQLRHGNELLASPRD